MMRPDAKVEKVYLYPKPVDWLGHESPVTTHGYVEVDLAMKERAL